jgi:hypothetical protein
MKKLPPGEAARRIKARNRANVIKRREAKAAYKLLHGHNPPTTEARKEQMKLYARAKRAAAKALLPPRIKKEKPVKPTKPPKPIKMQQAIKQQPPKAIRHSKPDLFKQPEVIIKPADDTGKIRFEVKPGLWVMLPPERNTPEGKEQVRDRYLNR